mmetsp:Transcript_19442/g.44285  ORF Transcript_19442/g.44285 Transcript_19442/m.44285 type:complete len:456 (-) Transcript_19442:58-1425(-)
MRNRMISMPLFLIFGAALGANMIVDNVIPRILSITLFGPVSNPSAVPTMSTKIPIPMPILPPPANASSAHFLSNFVMTFDDFPELQLTYDQITFWEERTAAHIRNVAVTREKMKALNLEVDVTFLQKEMTGTEMTNGAQFQFNVYIRYLHPSGILLADGLTAIDFQNAVLEAYASRSRVIEYLLELKDANDFRSGVFSGVGDVTIEYREAAEDDNLHSKTATIIVTAVLSFIGLSMVTFLAKKVYAIVNCNKEIDNYGNDDESSTNISTCLKNDPSSAMYFRQEGALSSHTGTYFFNSATNVSDIGSTINPSITSSEAERKVQGAIAAAAVAPSSGQTVFSDETSFENYRRRVDVKADGSDQRNIEVIDVIVPVGKLGLSIDTPNANGAPIVEAIKEGSPLIGKIEIGDIILAIDDEDVRTMTAVRVSKIISRKSEQAQRKFTILRCEARASILF